ncbi:DNA mismatch repair protein MutL [Actinoplanes sp. KI2]|uniref:DNA mismatch repair protein MutL n=1 Tax=Actinoplanes sp. KI2 TaxID=2983315 RepID=UPI0021D5FFC6|nr:DNA mismatch repair protein MutL [Actinoplanes sp. KI2]MCU7722278.1 DNA mismatch repair protein MutL [Actinoplanes sp. KI2]
MGSSRWTPIAGWAAATATSIVLASVAILPVLRTSEPRDAALAQLPAAATTFPAPLPSVTTSAGAPTTSPASRRPRTSAATPKPTSKPATKATAPPTTTEDGWTVTTAADGLRTYVRSFQCAGGQAVIKVTSDSVVSLITATPADGFAVEKVQNSKDNMAVYFNETNHSFIIHVTWFTDKPFAEVSEVGQ